MKVELWGIDRVRPYDQNPRRNDSAVEAVARSIETFGFRQPIVVDGDGVIVVGHTRWKAAKSLGLAEVPVHVAAELTPEQARAYRIAIADNQLSNLSSWEDKMLRAEVADLKTLGVDLEVLGFEDADLAKILAKETEGLSDPDEVPEAPKEPISKPGDVWLLGEHRLMCGDSTKAEDVARLMDGAKADLCFTSPPYALGKSVVLRGNNKGLSGNAYDDHDDNPAEWYQLMAGWRAAWMEHAHATIANIQPLAGNKRALVRWIADEAERLVDIITWNKGSAAPQMAKAVLTSSYEWLIVLAGQGASRSIPFASWKGTVKAVVDVQPSRGGEFAAIHAATMPVDLPVWVMTTLCDEAMTYADPFTGTGTTIIAAEQCSRKCYGMEISPAYVDVAVARWEKFTGRKAERLADGTTRTGTDTK